MGAGRGTRSPLRAIHVHIEVFALLFSCHPTRPAQLSKPLLKSLQHIRVGKDVRRPAEFLRRGRQPGVVRQRIFHRDSKHLVELGGAGLKGQDDSTENSLECSGDPFARAHLHRREYELSDAFRAA